MAKIAIKKTAKVVRKKTITATAPKKALKRKFISFRPMIRSRHPSHRPLRTQLPLLPFRSVVRLGSTWSGDGRTRVQCNTPQAIRTSASKRLMKQAFAQSNVKTAVVLLSANTINDVKVFANKEDIGYPIVAKHIHGSRGTGNYLLKSEQELTNWVQGKTLENYIFEKFYSYSREYRLHVTQNGCFYTCRKMLKEETPEQNRWYRNDSNSVWIVETNPQFDKPKNWDAIVAESVKALKAVGLDIGAIDVKVQSAKTDKGKERPNPEFIILETNSAPSFGDITLEKYLEEIPKLLRAKFVNQ